MSVRGITTQKAGKVLAVNCDPEVIRILEVNLTHANLEVISAENGAVALRKIYTEKPDIILLDPALPDIDGMEICQQLKESQQSSYIPVILIGARNHRNGRMAQAEDGAIHHISKPFDPKEVVALVQAYLKRKERAENLNPLSGLPNQTQVNNEITGLIEQKKPFAVIYISMDNLKVFNKVYGYAQGDRTIGFLADIVCEAVGLFGNPDDMVGHLGGDKFVIISTPWKEKSLCRRITADFNRRIKTLYTDEHLQRGYIAYESPLGGEEKSPIMSLRVAVVTNQKRTFNHYLEVSEAAAEQINYLRHSSGSEDNILDTGGIEPDLAVAHRGVPYAHREEFKAVHGVLAWLDFIISELNIPITVIKDCLDSVEYIQVENLIPERLNGLRTIRENVGQLAQVMEGLTHLTEAERSMSRAVYEEVDLGNTLDWIMEQVRELATQRRIETDIEGVEAIGRLVVDRRNLTQGLLYIVRSEIKASPPGGRLYLRAAEVNEDFVSIQIANPNHYVPQPALDMLLQGQLEGITDNVLRGELYPAKLLIQGLGGKLGIASDEEKGITYTAIIPKIWQSWMQEVNALRLATEISRKEARAELKKINHLLASLVAQVPPAMKDSLEVLSGKVQELGVLCNRSLFLIDDLSIRLETQQDRLRQQEVEQMATLEATLTISSEIARSLHMGYIFDLGSARRVAKYALTIAKECRMSESECRALRYAALMKDLGLVLSTHDMVEHMIVPTFEEAVAIRARFNPVRKALSAVPFLSPALDLVMYRYERYDGTGSRFGVKGDNIPLGTRILAIADTFDSMVSEMSPQGALAPKLAVQKIADDSGLRFDPDIVNAFLVVWRRKELHLALSES